MKRSKSLLSALVLSSLLVGATAMDFASACTRTLFVGDDGLVITGRNMDWREDMMSNLYVFPAGIARDGEAGPNSVKWTSKYGSVITAGYDAGSTDGMNEKGLVANILYLAETEYPKAGPDSPVMSISLWGQYALDNFATVAEAVEHLKTEPFVIKAPTLPNGSPATLHLALSDATGDSAIFEYVEGKLQIHHGKDYAVMTNSPTYEKQLAINEYWKDIGGLTFLPGTNRAADRFARASFLLQSIPRSLDKNYIQGVPGQQFQFQAVASVMGVQRAVSVPLGITTPDQPNISSTIWRTVADQTNRLYYFDSATRPNTFWVDLNKLDLKKGAPVMKLTIANGQVYSGEVSADFKPAESFRFLPASM